MATQCRVPISVGILDGGWMVAAIIRRELVNRFCEKCVKVSVESVFISVAEASVS